MNVEVHEERARLLGKDGVNSAAAYGATSASNANGGNGSAVKQLRRDVRLAVCIMAVGAVFGSCASTLWKLSSLLF